MKKILITGGTGYLGRNLANFYKKKYKVFLGARNNKQNFLVKNLTNCEVVPLDVSNIESIYHWKDQLHQDSEFLLMIKSDVSKKESIQKIFDNYHSYDLPELIMVIINDGSAEYLEWMDQNLSKEILE